MGIGSYQMDHQAYSYRRDPRVPSFDDSRPLIVFDGLCVMCSAGVAWMLARDPVGDSRFAAIQDLIPQALYRHYGLDPDSFDTFMVLANGIAYTRWNGVRAAGKTMPVPWKGLSVLAALIPAAIGDRIYDWVQANRLRWFGSRSSCLIASASDQRRFLVASPAPATSIDA